MRRRLAATFAGGAATVSATTWCVTRVTDSPLVFVSVSGVLVAGAVVVGHVAAARLSSLYQNLVRRDRAIAIHASHELRTPLTALRLSLEDLTLWKQTPPDVANELTQAIRDLDRLADAVTEILEQHHDNRPIERVDVAAVVSATVARWRPRVADTHEITLDARGPLVAELPPDQVDEVLDAMMGHAATRCSETIAVDVRRHRSTIRVRVSYPGTRCPATGVIHATANEVDTDGNPDLAESGGLAESMGAYLTMEEEPDGTCLVLTIPAAGVWTPSLI